MNAQSATPSEITQGEAHAGGAEDQSRSGIERQLALLAELAEIGLTVARAIGREAVKAADDDADTVVSARDLGPAYDRVARAIRLTVALRSKLLDDVRRLDEGRALVSQARRARVQRIVNRVIDAETGDLRAVGRFTREARERLDHDDIYGDVMTLPVSELVGRICKDLGLAPNWAELAQQAWAQEEVAGGAVGPPLAEWMAGLSDRPAAAADPPRQAPRSASP